MDLGFTIIRRVGLLLSICYATYAKSTTTSTTPEPSGCGWPGGDQTIPQKWHKEIIPNPQLDLCKCGRKGKKSWVCDPNQLLSYSEADQIDSNIENLRSSTGDCHCGKKCSKSSYLGPNYRGYQAGVVILNAIQIDKINPSSKDRVKVADKFTDHLRDDKWRFGLCDDDLVIIVSDVDRVVHTATGDEISAIVTDACVTEITDNNKQYLSNKDYGTALANMINEYSLALKREHRCNKPAEPASTSSIIIGICSIIGFIGGILGITFLCKKCGHCKGGGGNGGGYSSPQKYKADSPKRSRHNSEKSNSSGGGGDTF